jgi:polyisoprenoid-binding protein YceI
MRARCFVWILPAVLFIAFGAALPAHAAEDYAMDPMHAGVGFKISHLGLSWVQGRFDRFAGGFTLDPDDANRCSFVMTINADSVDTNNQKRDDHLRSPDFFNVKQFPTITFKSTSVKAIPDGYQVTGDLSLHGVTRPVTLGVMGGRKAEFPKGVQRTGFSTEVTLKRSEFGMDKLSPAVGDDVYIVISFEGTKK